MRRSDDDLLRVPENQLDRLSVDELLRLVVITRDGDTSSKKRARKAWETLVALDIDRVRGLVESFNFPRQPGVRVHRDDVDPVVHDCWLRLRNMLATFRGTSEGEYRAAMRTCITYACMDHCRSKMTEDMTRAGSFDEQLRSGEGNGKGRFEDQIAKKEFERIDDEEAIERECERNLELNGRLNDAIANLDGNRRRVLELTRAGRSTEEIAAELETSPDNVYQLRRRALKDVRRILDEDGEL